MDTVKNVKPATITGYRTSIANALCSQGELISNSLELNRHIPSLVEDRAKQNISFFSVCLGLTTSFLAFIRDFLAGANLRNSVSVGFILG